VGKVEGAAPVVNRIFPRKTGFFAQNYPKNLIFAQADCE
jgi:hypothetical protein